MSGSALALSPNDTMEGGLTDAQRRAAWLLAEGKLPVQTIADEIDVSRRTLWRWRRTPAFVALVKDYAEQLDAETYGVALARRRNRVHALGRLAVRIESQLETRLSGELIASYRGLLDDIAKELGHRVNKVELDAQIDAHVSVAPPQLIRIRGSEFRPTDRNRDGEGWHRDAESGQWVNRAGEVWDDEHHGRGRDLAASEEEEPIEAKYLIASSDPHGVRIEALTEQLLAGLISRAAYDAEILKVGGS